MNRVRKLYPVALIVVGVLIQIASLLLERGHNILLVTGLFCVLFGALRWIRNQKKS